MPALSGQSPKGIGVGISKEERSPSHQEINDHDVLKICSFYDFRTFS